MSIPFVFRPQVARESVEQARRAVTTLAGAVRHRRLSGEYLSSPSGARAEMNRQHMCRPSGAQVFVRHLTEA